MVGHDRNMDLRGGASQVFTAFEESSSDGHNTPWRSAKQRETKMVAEGQRVATNQVSGLRVHSGSASGPISKWVYRIPAPLPWWKRSSYSRMVEEICSLPSRIQAMLRLNAILRGRGFQLPPFEGQTRYLEVLRSCTSDIEELQAENNWMTSLDLEMAAKRWAKGFQFAVRTCKESSLPSQLS